MRELTVTDVLDALLDSWDRNNRILVNLLRAIPADALHLRPMDGSPTIARLFTHMHYCRLLFVKMAAAEVARAIPPSVTWASDPDIDVEQMAAELQMSSEAIKDAVKGRLASGRPMDVHYDHPVLLLQHFIWHEGYHHGQIKLTLKLAGRPFDDEEIGVWTWDEWMEKGRSSPRGNREL